MVYLLDTNILADLVRRPAGPVTARIREVGEDQVSTSVVVAAELRFGARKSNSRRLSDQLDAILGVITILPLEPPIDEAYANIRTDLEQRGNVIGANDLFIAAHAVSMDLTLVTDNTREFSRVPELRVENWLRT